MPNPSASSKLFEFNKMCCQFQNIYGLTDVFKWNGNMKAIGGGFVGKY